MIFEPVETHRWLDQNATRRSTNGRSLVMRAVSAACISDWLISTT